MQKFCTNCGAPWDENSFICPNCGALPGNEPEPEQQVNIDEPSGATVTSPAAKPAKGLKWWMVAVPAVLAVIVVAAVCWQSLLMLISPKTTLSLAMNRTNDSLSKRYEDGPASVFEKASGFEKNGEMILDLDMNYSGQEIGAELSVGFNKEKKQTAVGAALRAAQKAYSGNLYLDPDAAAVSVDFFKDGAYYGVTFDTFQEDMKKSVLGESLTDEQINQIDEMIQTLLDSFTSEDDTQSAVEPYRQIVADFADNLEATKDSDEIRLDGKSYKCDTVSFELDEDTVAELLEQLIEVLEDDEDLKELICNGALAESGGEDMEQVWEEMINSAQDALDEVFKEIDFTVNLIYYVRGGRVVNTRIDAEIEADGQSVDIRMNMNYGLKATSDLKFTLSVESMGEEMTVEVTSAIKNDKETFKETVSVEIEIPDADLMEAKIVTKWNKESGKLTLTFGYGYDSELEEISVACKLKELDNGFEISIDQDDLADMLEAIGVDAEMPADLEFTASVACIKGVDITKPDFTNLDKWDAALLQELQDTIYEEFYEESVSPMDAA